MTIVDITNQLQQVYSNDITLEYPPLRDGLLYSNIKIKAINVKLFNWRYENYNDVDDAEIDYKNKKLYNNYRDGIYTSRKVDIYVSRNGNLHLLEPSITESTDLNTTYTEGAASTAYRSYYNLESDTVRIVNNDLKFPAYVEVTVTSGLTNFGFNKYTYVIPPRRPTSYVPLNFGCSYAIDGHYKGSLLSAIGSEEPYTLDPVSDISGTDLKYSKVWSADMYDIPSKSFKNNTVLNIDKMWDFYLLNAAEIYQLLSEEDKSDIISQANEPYTPGLEQYTTSSFLPGVYSTGGGTLEDILKYGHNRRRSAKLSFNKIAPWFADFMFNTINDNFYDVDGDIVWGTNLIANVRPQHTSAYSTFSDQCYSAIDWLESHTAGNTAINISLNKDVQNRTTSPLYLDRTEANKMPRRFGTVPTFSYMKLHVSTFEYPVFIGNPTNGVYHYIPPRTTAIVLLPNKKYLNSDRYNAMYDANYGLTFWTTEDCGSDFIVSIDGVETAPDIRDIMFSYNSTKTMELVDMMYVLLLVYHLIIPSVFNYSNFAASGMGLHMVITKVFWELLSTTFVDLYDDIHTDSAI